MDIERSAFTFIPDDGAKGDSAPASIANNYMKADEEYEAGNESVRSSLFSSIAM